LDFDSRQMLDDLHWATTHRAAPEVVRATSVLVGLRLLCCAEQLKAERQERGASSVGQETEVTDAHKAFGEQVQPEAAQELVDW
jgi:hypothetical protein